MMKPGGKMEARPREDGDDAPTPDALLPRPRDPSIEPRRWGAIEAS